MKIIIHIGFPKTGSTALQSFLYENRLLLLKNLGVLYPNPYSDDCIFGYWSPYRRMHCEIFFDLLSWELRPIEEVINKITNIISISKQHGVRTIIFSCEAHVSSDIISALYLDKSVEIWIISYIRRQDYYIESGWKQWGHKKFSSIDEFLLSQNNIGSYWLNQLKAYSLILATDRIIVRPYEKDQLFGDIISDFLRVFGLDSILSFPNLHLDEKKVNKGFSNAVVDILANNRTFFNSEHDNVLLDFFEDYLSQKSMKNNFEPYNILSPNQKCQIIELNREFNEEIARSFLGREDGQLFYEPIPDPTNTFEQYRQTLNDVVPVFTQLLYNSWLDTQKQIRKIKERLDDHEIEDQIDAKIQFLSNQFAKINIPLHLLKTPFIDHYLTINFERNLELITLNDNSLLTLKCDLFTETGFLQISLWASVNSDIIIQYRLKHSSCGSKKISVHIPIAIGENQVYATIIDPQDTVIELIISGQRQNKYIFQEIYYKKIEREFDVSCVQFIDQPCCNISGFIDSIHKDGEELILRGWQIDTTNRQIPDMILNINTTEDKIEKTKPKIIRDDIAKSYHDEIFLRCGWSFRIEKACHYSNYKTYGYFAKENKAYLIPLWPKSISKYRFDCIGSIRRYLSNAGHLSQTSIKYQDMICSFLEEHNNTTGNIIEIGCFRGGLTSQLAFFCIEQKRKIHVIDICPENINLCKQMLTDLGLINCAEFFCMDFHQYSFLPDFFDDILLVVIDGDHRYEGVKKDSITLKENSNKIEYAIFHDYSLRSKKDPNVLVDRAIGDIFGEGYPLIMIGDNALNEDTRLNTLQKPLDDNHYFIGSEGAILSLKHNKINKS